MHAVDEDTLPRLTVFFDPDAWIESNPMQHPEVYKLNKDQLWSWAEDVTAIRRSIERKA